MNAQTTGGPSAKFSIPLSIVLIRLDLLGDRPREEEVEKVRDQIAVRVRAWLSTREAADFPEQMRSAIAHENSLLAQGEADIENLMYNLTQLRAQFDRWDVAIT